MSKETEQNFSFPTTQHKLVIAENSECRFILWKDNAYFTKIGKRLTSQIVEKLLKDGRARLKDCKSQKTGKTYNADILLCTEADGRPQFSLEFDKRKGDGK